MIITAPYRNRNPRLATVAGIVGCGLLVLLVALFRVQVMHGEHFGDREEAQSLRRIRIPSARGEIVDRNGVVLANNRPSYDIAIYLDQLGPVPKKTNLLQVAQASVFNLSTSLGLTKGPSITQISNHLVNLLPVPLPVWRGASPETVAMFAERASMLPGADLIVTPVRQYPQGTLAAHVVGFLGRTNQDNEQIQERFFHYKPDTVGRKGVERACDEYLRGAPGGRTIRVNPRGARVGEVGETEAEHGDQVMLTIDAHIQKLAEEALAGARVPNDVALRGAVVVLDPRDGEVLAMASAPSFDPNIFNSGTPDDVVNAVLEDSRHPLINRALSASYAPGSTFKPVTLLAGLEAGTIAMNDRHICDGGLQIGDRKFRCHGVHNDVDAMKAMAWSCDVWFYQEGMKTGVGPITRMANELGLGLSTGFELGGLDGLVPTAEWKQKRRNQAWWKSDTAQLSIGQSDLLVTPLQMANVAATLANGGTRWRPYIVKRITEAHGAVVEEKQPEVAGRLSAKPGNIELVRQTMLGVIEDPKGTAHKSAIMGLRIAAKTGTAEFQKKEHHNRAWFIGFAPYDHPTVALAVMIEEASGGGAVAGPVAQKILAGIFEKKVDVNGGENTFAD